MLPVGTISLAITITHIRPKPIAQTKEETVEITEMYKLSLGANIL